jgi:hypothetical protein
LVVPAAAAAGFLLSLAAVRALERFVSGVGIFANFSAGSKFMEPAWVDFSPDPVVLVFVVGLIAVSVLLSGLIPGWRASGVDAVAILKDDTRTGTSLGEGNLSRLLVTCQIALAVALLVGTGTARTTFPSCESRASTPCLRITGGPGPPDAASCRPIREQTGFRAGTARTIFPSCESRAPLRT